ncbi:MFS transporter [Nocardiopsis sp. RSe5-2]|uniref:MFS transporter n=1 Tax=Nocardiopsis endophytica TaxID=3018445 RepID=A0ABT4UDN9_9ACTN|nr:MFS transporter [Nocardiopsis endophytica]MDA2814851.1 MFS transporter [Nocardiopsis endophytica]
MHHPHLSHVSRPAHHRPAVWAFGLGAFSVQFDSFALNLALPSIGADLGMAADRLPAAVAAYLLACGAAMVPGGGAGDRVGHRRVLLAGLTAFAAGSVLCALAADPAGLIAFRALQGLGGGLVMPSGLALIARTAPAGRAARATGRALGAAGLATAAGPVAGGALTSLAGWPWVFWAVVPLAAAAAGAALAVREPSPDPRPTRRPPGTRPIRVLRAAAPAAALGAAANAATVVWLFTGPLALQRAWGLDAAAAGLVFAAPALAVAAGGPLAGRAAARPLPVLTALTGTGAGLLATLGALPSVPLVAAALTACGLVLGTANALALIAVQQAAPPDAAGLASGAAKTAVTAAGGLAMVAVSAAMAG